MHHRFNHQRRGLTNRRRVARAATLLASLLSNGVVFAQETPVSEFGPSPELPAPAKTLLPTIHVAKAIGWPAGGIPTAIAGTRVTAFARDLDHPRWLYVLPNGDVLVAESDAPAKPDDAKGFFGTIKKFIMKRAGSGTRHSANRITLLRDKGGGSAPERHTFLDGLNSPIGMALIGDNFYVADSDALLRFPYHSGDTEIRAKPTQVSALPGGTINHHWTKTLLANPEGSKLYVGVGSNSNIGENGFGAESERAAIWEIDPQSGGHRVFASGLRNPVGLAWSDSGALWVAVNERDELGDHLPPDYMTSVRDGAFYGWPFSYYGQHVDERVTPQDPALVAAALSPDYALGAHTASLGLCWSAASQLPANLQHGMFIGQHGSWNRSARSGYKVIFVRFDGGKPTGLPIEVLTGFLDSEGNARGRPVGVAIDNRGSLLVADDVGNTIWRVSGT